MRWIVLTAAITLSAVALYMLRGELQRAAGLSRPKPGSASSADSDEPVQIFAAGIVEGLQSPLELRFETAGRIKAVRVREGDSVRANQILADLETDSSKLRVTQAKAQLQIAVAEQDRLNNGRRTNSNASQAGRDSRAAQEGTHRLVSDTSTASKEDLSIVDARVVAAEAAVMQEQLLLSKTRLVAPMDGTILAMTLKEGELVGPSSESNSIAMVNRTRTRVRAFVEEMDAMDVEVGQQAVVMASGHAKRKYAGTILSCAPFVQPKSHRHLNPGERLDVRVREVIVELDDGAELLVGLPVEVFISRDVPPHREEYPAKRASPRKRAGSASRQRSSVVAEEL